MDKRLDVKNVGLDRNDNVGILPGEEVIHKMGGHNQVFHGMRRFWKGFYKKAGAAIREGTFGGSKDCPGGEYQL